MILSSSPLVFSPSPIALSISPFPRSIRCKCFAHPTPPPLRSCATFSPPISAVAAPDPAAVVTGEDLPEDYDQWLPVRDPSCRRRAGVLLHPTSLHGPHGIGDLGDEALKFLDWLHSSGCSVWQVLPLAPPGRKPREDGSPYSGQDANCGNTLLISLEELVKDGLLTEVELPNPMDMEHVEFETVASIKDPLIAKVITPW